MVVGIGVGTACIAWWSMRQTLRGRFVLGTATVGVAALAGVALTFLLDGPLLGLTVPTGAVLIGFALAAAAGGDEPGDGPDDEPPWWPSFERDLRRYERATSRRRLRVR